MINFTDSEVLFQEDYRTKMRNRDNKCTVYTLFSVRIYFVGISKLKVPFIGKLPNKTFTSYSQIFSSFNLLMLMKVSRRIHEIPIIDSTNHKKYMINCFCCFSFKKQEFNNNNNNNNSNNNNNNLRIIPEYLQAQIEPLRARIVVIT